MINLTILVLLGLLFHTYVLYPWLLKFLRKPKQVDKALEDFPKVSFIVAAYNEEACLPAKIANFKDLNYPVEKLEILIGSDGSIDGTNDLLKGLEKPFNIFLYQVNEGKAMVLNKLVREASGEVLIFCDANTILAKDAVQELVSPFVDRQVGCVCGQLILNDSGKTHLGGGESLYWQIEKFIKAKEGQLGVLMGANGALYAIRKALFKELPTHKTIMDDFYISIQVMLQGFKCTYQKSAQGMEATSKQAMGEFQRKIRIGQANYHFLGLYLNLLNPLQPIRAFCFLSHKLLRWFAPHFLLLLFLLSFLFIYQSLFLKVLFLLQVLFYSLAYWAYKKEGTDVWKGAKIAFYFSSMNLALALGFWRAIQPSAGGGWERIERDEE